MVDTLDSLRQELPAQPLCLIIGLDAFVQLNTWHRWERLIELAHIAVMTRPGLRSAPAGEVAALLERCLVDDPQVLHAMPAGRIMLCPVTRMEISATQIRALVAQDRSARYLVPEPVLEYIRQRGLYRQSNIAEVGP
jgi:nicotinate-nucleotide adenylyltransferase